MGKAAENERIKLKATFYCDPAWKSDPVKWGVGVQD